MSLDVTTLALAKSYTNQHGGDGGQVQSDWNQNDKTAPDYVKNRPFYTETVETVLVEESTVSFADPGSGFYTAEFPSTLSATVGETYKVYWDGTTYESTCVDFRDMPVIGNLSIGGVGSDTGEPFAMQVANGEGIIIITADTSASHTFSISGFAQEVVKIDEKYLPSNLATTEYVDNSVSNPLNITSATVGQIAKITAVDDSGKPTAWEPVDMPSGGDNETNFQLVFNQECLLDADVSVYEVDIDFGLQDFKEFIALIEYSKSTNNTYQDEITFDGVIIVSFGGQTYKGSVLRRVIYAKRTTQTEYMGIHRASGNGFGWASGNTPSTLSYFSDRIKPSTGKIKIWRNNSAEATTITIKLYKR